MAGSIPSLRPSRGLATDHSRLSRNVLLRSNPVRQGADVNQPLPDTGTEETIQLLLEAGPTIDAKDMNGDSPHTWASWQRIAHSTCIVLQSA